MEYLFIILSVLAFIGLAQIRRIFEIEANQTRLINSLISAVVGVPLVILFELYILREHVTGVLAFGNFCSYTVFGYLFKANRITIPFSHRKVNR